MTKNRIARRLLAVVVGSVAWVVTESAGLGQFAPSLPFNPYTSQYQAFSFPTVVNPSLPNQARVNSVYGGRNIFQQPLVTDPFLPPLSMDTGALPRGVGGIPYHAAFRLEDRFGSTYSQADIDFANNSFLRDQLFFRLNQERDPQKRDELLKQFAEVNQKLRSAGVTGRRMAGTGRAETAVNELLGPSARRTSRGTAIAAPPRAARPRTTPPETPPASTTLPATGADLPLPPLDRPLDATGTGSILDRTAPLGATSGPGGGSSVESVLSQPSVLDRINSTRPASDRRRGESGLRLPGRPRLGAPLGSIRPSETRPVVPPTTTPRTTDDEAPVVEDGEDETED
jgi:hypothetical protein